MRVRNPKRSSTLLATALAAGLALASCSSPEPASEGTAGEAAAGDGESDASVAAKVAAANVKPLPGRWEVQMQVKSFDIPGVPAAMKDMLRNEMTRQHMVATCLTPEEAAQPQGKFFKPGNDQCSYKSFEMEGGKIAATMTCSEQGMTQDMRMEGTYSEDAYDIAIETNGEMNGQPMTMAMDIVSKRVGECRGDETG